MIITGVDIFAFCCIFFIPSYFLYIIYYAPGLYGINPFLRPSPLTSKEKHLLKSKIAAISFLKEDEKEKLFKRTAWFRSKKTFSFRGPVANKPEVELLVSATGVLVTLGMRHFKYIRSIHRIIIYPSDYYSVINKRHHLGEYNVGLKTLVFAEDSLRSGFEDSTDNINLAVHEFAHALYFETTGKNTWEAMRFQWGFKKLEKIHSDSKEMNRVEESGYFRDYGETNVFEFFSVLSENYMETPFEFKNEFSDLHDLVQKMLNFEFTDN